jgi:pimeloyl-ACP methyl ester carboxylesterase
MSDLGAADLEAEARRLVEELGKPKRRVRPRLARLLNEAEDLEVATSFGGIMAWRLGTGRATLMVHGWEDDNALWSPLIDLNAEMMRGSVAFDLPGHGWSPAEDCSIQAAGKAVLAVAEAFGPIDSVVAHSFGCPTTIYALGHGLEAPRAVLIGSPVPRTKPYDRTNHDWSKEQIDAGEDPEVVARAAEILRERMANATEPFAAIDDEIKAMTAKALILHSIDDDAAPYENARAMADLWPGAELVLADDLGHRLIAQDQAIVQRIIDFVEDF